MRSRYRAALRRHCVFRSAADALVVVKTIRNADLPGSATFVFFDGERRCVDLVVVRDGADHLPRLIDLTCRALQQQASGLFIVTDRTGEVPADRPDDELVWMELVDAAAHHGVTLVDWFVAWGTKAFSVAEFAPLPAGW